MKRNVKTLGVALVATAAMTVGLTACGVDDDDDRASCSTVYVPMFFSTVDRHYHYDSPKGKVVPAHKVPQSARKVSGYKPPAATVNKTPKGSGKVDTTKPGGSAPKAPAAKVPAPAPKAPAAKVPAPAPKAPAAPAPAPRVGGRR